MQLMYVSPRSQYPNSWFAYCNGYYYGSGYCYCSCPLKPGFDSAGPYCENCLPRPLCGGTYNETTGQLVPGSPVTCPSYSKNVITGLDSGNFVRAWDGKLANGADAMSPDRKSGQAFNTRA